MFFNGTVDHVSSLRWRFALHFDTAYSKLNSCSLDLSVEIRMRQSSVSVVSLLHGAVPSAKLAVHVGTIVVVFDVPQPSELFQPR